MWKKGVCCEVEGGFLDCLGDGSLSSPCKFDGKSFQENGKKFSVAKVESFTPLDGEVAKKIPTFYILYVVKENVIYLMYFVDNLLGWFEASVNVGSSLRIQWGNRMYNAKVLSHAGSMRVRWSNGSQTDYSVSDIKTMVCSGQIEIV